MTTTTFHASLRAPCSDSVFESAVCPLCGPQAASDLLFQARDWMYPADEWFGLHRCHACNLVFVSPRPVAEHLGDYYPDNYPPHIAPSPSPPRAHLSWRRRLRVAALTVGLGYPAAHSASALDWAGKLLSRRLLRAGYPAWRPHGVLLDVGCGRGDFLRVMKELGWTVFGLDFAPRAIEQAQRQGIAAAQGLLADLDWPDASIDVITFQDSFEHHPDPLETLRAAARLLRPGGSLIIRFPNFNAFWRRIFGAYWADIAVPRHLYHYTPATLARMLDPCGFSVERVYILPSSEFSRSLQIWEKAHGRPHAPLRPWARTLDRLVSFGHALVHAHRR